MKEELKHKETFEQYYIMGGDRSLAKLREKLMSLESRQNVVNLRTLQRWSKAFHWQERIEQRDIEVSRGLEDKTNETIISIKAGFKAEIKAQLNIFKVMLNRLIKKFKEDKENGIIEIKKIEDLKVVTDSYEKLIKLYLTLIGEASEIEEIELKDAKEKLLSKINSIIAREKKAKGARRNKKPKRKGISKPSI
jgi:hypothetical protein